MKTRTFTTEHGTFDSYAVMLEGETEAVEIVQKPATPPPSGEISGTIETSKWGRKLKKEQLGGYSGGSKSDPATQKTIVRQNSLTNAVAYCTAKANLDKDYKLTGKEVIQVATYFAKYSLGEVTVVTENKPEEKTEEKQTVVTGNKEDEPDLDKSWDDESSEDN